MAQTQGLPNTLWLQMNKATLSNSIFTTLQRTDSLAVKGLSNFSKIIQAIYGRKRERS